jgi:hypothetical protein
VVLKSSRTVIVVTDSLKADVRGDKGHTSESLWHQSAKWHRAMNMQSFYMSALSISHFVLSEMDGKIKQCVCIKFCMKLSKSAIETPEMFHEAYGEHFLSQTAAFEWQSCFNAGLASAEDNESSG